LLIAALNGLHALCREKIWTIAGPEFGSDEGSVMIIVRALYGLKSSGAAFRSMLADRLYEIGYRPTRGDPDVWLRPAITNDGTNVYEYVLVYVDDIFCVSPNTALTMSQIQESFKFKNDEVKPPDTYLTHEELPSDAPEPRGRPVQISCFVDADHAANRQTRKTDSGVAVEIALDGCPIGGSRQYLL
jgi:hypothetical protein